MGYIGHLNKAGAIGLVSPSLGRLLTCDLFVTLQLQPGLQAPKATGHGIFTASGWQGGASGHPWRLAA
jgi:hypothetical protein